MFKTKLLSNNKGETFIQFGKFCLVGVLNTLVDWASFYSLTLLITPKSFETVVKAIAFLIAMVNSYFWNSKWTFKKEHQNQLRESDDSLKTRNHIIIKFFIVSFGGWLINVSSFWLVRFQLDQGKIVALVVASASATTFNFVMNKYWTYREREGGS